MTTIRVWAPRAKKVELALGDERLPMRRVDAPPPDEGWWEADTEAAVPGTDYAFCLDDGPPRPDPRSRHQPGGVHGASRLVDPQRFAWTDDGWTGQTPAGAVVYELHIGTFTPEGTFDAAIGRLDHLAQLGVDVVEIMPVAAFPGEHGWGYDGVALWAVHDPYGGPEGLARFVDACHARGISVLLDVVYNHLGPSGNYLAEFGPYFTEKHHTPWGWAVNLDDAGSDQVRAFIVENALSWLRDYHLDGLRLDAVHALADTRAVHILEQLAAAVDDLAVQQNRNLTLIAETDLNDPRIITPRTHHGYGVHAQWSDDFHHALHSLLTGERQAYYADFGSIAALVKTLTGAYFHDGTWSSFRGRTHGRPVDTALLGGDRFVAFLQDHDQIGNRAQGDRIGATLSPGRARIGAALLLTSPFTPMLFMGEEWGAATPWQYFTDHPDRDLGEAVREGRRNEFAEHGWSADEVPDPQDPATFGASKLDWDEITKQDHADLLAWYRRLIALRHSDPDLSDPRLTEVHADFDDSANWLVVRRGRLRVAVNLADHEQTVPLDTAVAEVVLTSAAESDEEKMSTSPGDTVRLPAESVAILRTA
ncbi:MAG TPA: malto-oligosyltrehalose trehalohydrolase [Jatrophihabitantaceae bacterium]|nr:malto-oligosyltrehalose trehalohydrolase [Jatrophihabitantaceae bacterium]